MQLRILNVIVIDPISQGQGVGKLLVNHGISQAEASSPPLPCYLEATEAGFPVYKKLGFEEVDRLVVHGLDEDGKEIEGDEVVLPTMLRPPNMRS